MKSCISNSNVGLGHPVTCRSAYGHGIRGQIPSSGVWTLDASFPPPTPDSSLVPFEKIQIPLPPANVSFSPSGLRSQPLSHVPLVAARASPHYAAARLFLRRR